MAGGIAVSYIILRLLPGVSKGQEVILEKVEQGTFLAALEQHVYLLVLISFIFFYGMERLATKSKQQQEGDKSKEAKSEGVFWIHISTFSFLNILISYLLLDMLEEGLTTLLVFFIAMFLKFIVNDHSLHRIHKQDYDRKGRWILAGAVFLGWGASAVTQHPEVVAVFLQALVAGGALLNVLKEELPEARESNFWAFAISGVCFSTLMIMLSQ